MKPWILAAFAALASAHGPGAHADVAYRFLSGTYSAIDNYNPPCSAGTCIALPTDGQVQGYFVTASPLPPHHSIATDISAQVTRWSFSNGAIGLSSTPARPDMRVHGFKVATDASGNITQSIITVSRWANGLAGPHADGDLVEYINVNTHGGGTTMLNTPCLGRATVGGVSDVCVMFGSTATAPAASGAAYPDGGAWTLDAPRPAFSATTISAVEGFAGTQVLVFTVTPDKPSATEPMRLDWRTVNGTASAGSDYTAANGTLTWAPGNRDPQRIEITIHGDTVPEANESFTVELSNFVGMAPGAVTTATGTIVTDDAAAPTVTLGNASLAEGDTGTALMSFTAHLSATPTATVTMDWSTANGTASAGSDYTAATGSLRWDAGDDLAKTFTVAIHGDTTAEANETFTVTLSNLSGATAGAATTATGTITNDDGALPAPAGGGVQAVPTLSQWGMLALSAVLALGAVLRLRRRA